MPISGKNKMQIIKLIKKNSLRNIGEEDRIIEESNPALLPLTTIAAYNKLVPGAAEDLLREYIEDRKQHRKIEMMEAKDRQKGRYFAMVITILCVAAVALIGIYSEYWIKISLLLISVLPMFIYRFQNPSAEHLTLAQSIKRRLSNFAARKE